jgi:hypothetical protein
VPFLLGAKRLTRMGDIFDKLDVIGYSIDYLLGSEL